MPFSRINVAITASSPVRALSGAGTSGPAKAGAPAAAATRMATMDRPTACRMRLADLCIAPLVYASLDLNAGVQQSRIESMYPSTDDYPTRLARRNEHRVGGPRDGPIGTVVWRHATRECGCFARGRRL